MSDAAASGPPLVEARDFALLAGYATLAPVAWLLPQSRWPALCRWLAASLTGPLRRRRNDIWTHMQRFAPADASAIHTRWIANRIEAEMQYLVEVRAGALDVKLTIRGQEHLAAARESGKGAVLWVAPALFAQLLVKRALAEAGFPASHLSREFHGPSDSRLGHRLINPLTVARESRYLQARFPMVDGQEQQALRQLVTALKRGKLISVTCASYGRRLVPIPLLGAWLPVAAGAPSLALMSSAPLLPVTLVRRDWRTFEIIIAPPLTAVAGDRDSARHSLMSQYSAFLAQHFATDPAMFADWRNLRTDPPPAENE